MKEKLVDIVLNLDLTPNEQADLVLALLHEEIAKAALTREEVWEAYRADESSGDVVGIAEAQLQKILALAGEGGRQMTDEKQDISPRIGGMPPLILTIIGVVLAPIGLGLLMRVWTWEPPLVLLLGLGVAGFAAAWVYLLACLFYFWR